MSKKTFLSATLLIGLLLHASAYATQTMTDAPQGRTVTVTAVTDNIIQVTNTASPSAVGESVVNLVAAPGSGASTFNLSSQVLAMTTPSGIVVTANSGTGEVTIDGGSGKIVTDPGLRLVNGNPAKQELTLYTTAQGSYYGAGERGHSLNLRGDTLVNYNRQNYGYTGSDPRISQMNITMPLFLSTDGFAILFDDHAASEMVLGGGNEIQYITESRKLVSYYYVNGSTLADLTRNLTQITGRQPLPPLWSLGYITSKYGYRDEKETVGAIDTLKRGGYPVDGIVLDLYWYGKEEDMGRLAWEPTQWPDPEKMLDKLKKENVNLVAISQPYVLRNGKAIDNYNYLAPRGMFVADSTGTAPQEVKIWVGEGGMFDVSNPETRAWMRDRYRQLTDMGITGWWGDLGEPEVHPETGLHANGLTAREYHNKYGNDWSKIIYDLFTEEYPDTRLMTMMRGGTTGLQKYSVFPWSTDVSRSWGGLQPQITIMLNSGLSGLGYMGHDVGGFAIDQDNPIDPELYVRWLQLGLFSPMLRTHAQATAEPYHYPEYQSIILPLVKERYRWLPYNYTLAYENSRYGYPLVRPLNFTEPQSNAYDGIDDEFLWGSEVLVAPVITQGATERSVTFPQGAWIDFRNPSVVYYGGSTIQYPAPLDVLPLFVRAGAVIPMADYKMESTADYDPGRLTIQYFPVAGVSRSYTMYDDNRVSPAALSDGKYRLVTFDAATDASGSSVINIKAEGTYPGAPEKLHLDFVVNAQSGRPQSVTVNGKKVSSKYDARTGCLTFHVTFDPAAQTTVKINR